jgi:hypothetical protein
MKAIERRKDNEGERDENELYLAETWDVVDIEKEIKSMQKDTSSIT